MNYPSLETGLAWLADYVRSQRSTTQRWRIRYTLVDYQAAYELHNPGRSFVETLDRTDFIRSWLDSGCQSPKRLRDWHTSMRGFARWLFEQQLLNHNVMPYVARQDVLTRSVPLLQLGRSLQRAITRFERSFRVRCDRYLAAAHRWNLYRNRPECRQWRCPEAEEECWRAWIVQVAQGPESWIWKRDLIWALGRFFDFLVDATDELLEANLFPAFLRHYPMRNLMEGRGKLDPAARFNRTALTNRTATTLPLPDWMATYRDHLENRGHRAGKGSATLSNLRVLHRVLERQSIRKPEQITADTIQAYLEMNDGREPGPSKGSTRLQRLITLQGLCRFLARRGIPAPLALVEGWPRARRSQFKPHIYTLNELSLVLAGLRRSAESSATPFVWQGLETIVFLLYACGLRAGEALRLRLGEVNLESRRLLVVKTKFYKERWVPIGAGAIPRLSQYLEVRERSFPHLSGPEQRVFLSSRGNPLSGSVLRSLFRCTVDSLGIVSRGTDPPRMHDLRHSMAVHRLYKWYSEGADVQNKLPLLAAYMGHGHYNSTEVYLHLADDLIRQAGRNFQQAFERVIGEVVREVT